MRCCKLDQNTTLKLEPLFVGVNGGSLVEISYIYNQYKQAFLHGPSSSNHGVAEFAEASSTS